MSIISMTIVRVNNRPANIITSIHTMPRGENRETVANIVEDELISYIDYRNQRQNTYRANGCHSLDMER